VAALARPPIARHVRARRPAIAGAGLVLFAAATVSLFFVSRGKWSDAIIDSGREWIVPDALARGELLYRDVVYWFGPFTPYFHALFFRAFGSSFVTLVAAGAVASAGVLAALFWVLRRCAGRIEAWEWTTLAVPVLVFMPNAGGGLLGMGYRIWHAAGFALAAVALAAHRRERPRLGAFLAGCLAGVSGLCRTEWGLAACAAVLLAVALGSRRRIPFGRAALAAVAGWATVFGGGLVLFLLLAGPQAVIREGHVLLTGLPPETRDFLLRYSGVFDWRRGLAQMAYSGAMWLGAATAVELLALGARDRNTRRPRLVRLGALLGVLALAAALGGGSGPVLLSAAPLVCAAALVIGLRRAPRPRGARLAAVGLLGLLLSYRRPFHIGDAAYVAPPLLFAFACAGALLSLAVARQRNALSRKRLRLSFAAASALLVTAAFAGRFAQYAADGRVAIGGTRHMLSALPDEAARLEAVAAEVERRTAAGDGLVCFPEGEVLNFLSGRRNTLRHKLYIPGYLTQENEPEILADLRRHPPGAVVIWNRPMGEYGRSFFGLGAGREVLSWLEGNYRMEVSGIDPRRSSRVLLGIRNQK
jgi:hypothetical protein